MQRITFVSFLKEPAFTSAESFTETYWEICQGREKY